MATVNDVPLDPAKPKKRFINSMIGWVILFTILIVGAILLQLGFVIIGIAVVFILMIGWQWWYENAYYKNYFYDIQPEFLNIKKGVITPREAIFPYEKLQDVYVDQDIFDRLFGLWDVHISTATMLSGMEAHIDGVSEENSKKLRDMILTKIKEAKRKTGAN
ncbi:MAG: PH domain-containing protein [Candidatus Micrarchaeota archaeon]